MAATAAFAEFYELLGLKSLNPLDTIARDVEELRREVDLVIVMSHLGLPMDRQLAETVPGIDLIIGGHTHHLLEEPLRIGRTMVTAAGKFGNYLGKVVIRRDSVNGRLMMDGICLPVVEGPKQEQVETAIALQREAARLRLNRTVAVTDRELPVSYEAESPFGNLLAQAVRRYTGSEFSLVNSGQLLSGLPAGEISEGMLHERCPSPINPCTMQVSGGDILASLEESLLEEKMSKSIMGFGFRGKVLGGICVDGLEIEYDPGAPPYERIVQASVAGVPLREDQTYLVGTLDMFTFGVGYERLKRGTEKRYMLPDFYATCSASNCKPPARRKPVFNPGGKK
ncbi:hypothetical protein HMSSN139_23440 [Paenibacillus sp. HMSSN-139]|nr:hypothetical protein HMSSN139_23440 [Paenibacillus sp. HMSSN-139]